MSKLCKKLTCLLLPFLLLGAYTEYNLRLIENGYSRKRIDMERVLDTTEVLVLGSSHALFGVDPAQFRLATFNMAYVSQTFYYDQRIVDAYLDRMPALKAVILPVSYFSLDTSMVGSTEKWRCYFYEKYFGFPVEGASGSQLSTLFDLKRYSLIALYGIPKSLKQLRNNFNLNEVKGQQVNGWLKRDLSVPLADRKGADRVALHERLMFPNQRPANISYLKAIAKRLRERGVNLYPVTLPVHRTYSAHVNSRIYNSMVTTVADFCDENGCRYLNFFTDDRFDDADFFDNDHLNATGAAKLSRLLAAELSL